MPQHIMMDLGTGNNNKINWAMSDKGEFIDIVEVRRMSNWCRRIMNACAMETNVEFCNAVSTGAQRLALPIAGGVQGSEERTGTGMCYTLQCN